MAQNRPFRRGANNAASQRQDDKRSGDHGTNAMDKTWFEHLTIDLIVHVLANSVFHPFIAWLVPVCLRATEVPLTSPKVLGSCVYAGLVSLCWLFGVVDQRIAYGLPRELDWSDEVVVITGGASGLGKTLAEIYGMRGASVAILDVRMPKTDESDGLARVQFYECDVGDADAVEKAKTRIEDDLGAPTILINNAGIVHGKPLLSLSAPEIQKTISVNLISHFNTIRTFLPAMLASPTGGTIVTVASVLGKLGARNLSDYTASKAGLIAMHASLRAELSSSAAPPGAENVRMVLVTPGQLSTALFKGVKTPSSFFGPVVEPVGLAREIVKMVDAGQSGEISLPLYARWIECLHVLPVGVQRMVRWLSGMDQAMDSFSKEDVSVHAAASRRKDD
ncbi:Hypothetical protein R9X50_00320000 [Acrodontium crateriforme]|uniref:NAD(P)-binding protein n=1 Tax=Acrodontium crateriforme TaxID=150365 RepID=A0AAQ3RBN6_9PEZI|nr:Hypothetical protein R9X50_00320000 [Acrodontium crateriforme]